MTQHCIETLFYKLQKTSRICHAFCELYFKEYALGEITYDEFIILDTVICNPEVCQRDLAKLILKGTSHLSKILNALEKRELIQRPIAKKGNRVVRKIEITENGINLHAFAEQIALDFAQKIENSIGENETKLCEKFLETITQTIKENKEIIFE